MAKRRQSGKQARLARRLRNHILKTLRDTGYKAPKGASMAKLRQLYKIATGANPPSINSFDKRR